MYRYLLLVFLAHFSCFSQQNVYIFDMTEFLSNMEKDWSIGNGININTGEYFGEYFEVVVYNGMNMNENRLEIMNSTITVYGDSINSGVVTKRFETSNLYFAPLLSVEELEENRIEIKMFPNPSNSFVHFIGEYIERLTVYDFSGKKIKSVKPKSNDFRIDVSSFSSGTYIVQLFLKDNKGVFKKLVIN